MDQRIILRFIDYHQYHHWPRCRGARQCAWLVALLLILPLLSLLSPPSTLPTTSSQLINSSQNPNFSLGSSSWVAPLASIYAGDLNHNYWHQWLSFFSGKLIPGSLVSPPSPQHINLGIVFIGVNSKVINLYLTMYGTNINIWNLHYYSIQMHAKMLKLLDSVLEHSSGTPLHLLLVTDRQQKSQQPCPSSDPGQACPVWLRFWGTGLPQGLPKRSWKQAIGAGQGQILDKITNFCNSSMQGPLGCRV